MMTQEHKDKISRANTGKIASPEHREKIRLAHLGQPSKLKGIPRNAETKQKIRESVRKVVKKGKDCNFWKGGINKFQWSVRKCWKYVEWRCSVFERDNYTCQDCGKNKCYIEAHHIIAFSRLLKENNIKTLEEAINCSQLWNIANGMTLCKECHKKTSSYLGGKVKSNY